MNLCVLVKTYESQKYFMELEKAKVKFYNMTLVYDKDLKRILFCKRKKNPYKDKLNFPGGKLEEGEQSINAADRELDEETGYGRSDVTPLCHLIDFTYYTTERMVEFYVCKLLIDKEPIQEEGGNELVWININGTDFSDVDVFAGDGNVLHCYNMAEKYRHNIFSENVVHS